MFERVPFQQVLQMNTDNTYPIDLFGRVTTLETLIQSLDDPYEDIFGDLTVDSFSTILYLHACAKLDRPHTCAIFKDNVLNSNSIKHRFNSDFMIDYSFIIPSTYFPNKHPLTSKMYFLPFFINQMEHEELIHIPQVSNNMAHSNMLADVVYNTSITSWHFRVKILRIHSFYSYVSGCGSN
ncbi:hypothetical protein YC2023_041023 [Brassica napus]